MTQRDLEFEFFKNPGILLFKNLSVFLKHRVEQISFSVRIHLKTTSKIFFDKRNSRNAVINCWIEPNNFKFMIFDLRFFVKR